VQADVADEAQVLAMFKRVQAELGPLQGLVNNAGVIDVYARLDEMSMARWRRMFDINVLGSMLCAREAVLQMSTKHGGQGGSIVNSLECGFSARRSRPVPGLRRSQRRH
jgi:NAD(P)-dependent dehydrogenase (short-subunit alcohol dehydrogenase family)